MIEKLENRAITSIISVNEAFNELQRAVKNETSFIFFVSARC